MESRIPLPTDNIFKFYALLGLLLFIFGAGSMLYLGKSTNELLFASIPKLAELQELEKPTAVQESTRESLKRKIEIAIEDKRILTFGSIAVMCLGAAMMLFGFGKWHTEIQPRQDEFAKLELEKLRHEVEKLKSKDEES